MSNPSYRAQGEVVIIADDSLFSKCLLGSYSVSTRAEDPACLWGAHSTMGEMDILTNYTRLSVQSHGGGRPGAVWRLAHPEGSLRLVGGMTTLWGASPSPRGGWEPAGWAWSEPDPHPCPLFCRSHHSAKPVSSVRLRGTSTLQSHRLCVPRVCFVSAHGLSRWGA